MPKPGQRQQHFIAAPFGDQIEGRRQNAELHFAFFHGGEDARRIGVGVLHQLDIFFRIDFQPAQRKTQRRVRNGAEGRADMAGLAFEIFDFLDAFLRHDLIGKNIDPGADQSKARRAFEMRGDEGRGMPAPVAICILLASIACTAAVVLVLMISTSRPCFL